MRFATAGRDGYRYKFVIGPGLTVTGLFPLQSPAMHRQRPAKSLALAAATLLRAAIGGQAPGAGPLARGVVTLPNEDGRVTVSWRLRAADHEKVSFHVYRRDLYDDRGFTRLTEAPVTAATTYVDSTPRPGASYRSRVHAIAAGGTETASADQFYVTATDWHRPYVSIAFEAARPLRHGCPLIR